MRITDEQFDRWQRDGYVIVEDFLTSDEVAAARENLARYFPTWEERSAAPYRYTSLQQWAEFPYAGDTLNNVATHPEIMAYVERALGTEEIALTQSIVWGKYPGGTNFEQPLHLDYGNNSLVAPRDDGHFRQVPTMIYYTDVSEDLGPTYIVSQQHTSHLPLVPNAISREDYPEVYEHERPVTVKAGTAILYSMRTWHRGSQFLAKEGARFSHHIVYRAAAHQWMGWRAWPRHGDDAEMKSFIEQATPRQREVLGFPPPGHEYWNEEMLDVVAARYPGMDISPYREASLSGAAKR